MEGDKLGQVLRPELGGCLIVPGAAIERSLQPSLSILSFQLLLCRLINFKAPIHPILFYFMEGPRVRCCLQG